MPSVRTENHKVFYRNTHCPPAYPISDISIIGPSTNILPYYRPKVPHFQRPALTATTNKISLHLEIKLCFNYGEIRIIYLTLSKWCLNRLCVAICWCGRRGGCRGRGWWSTLVILPCLLLHFSSPFKIPWTVKVPWSIIGASFITSCIVPYPVFMVLGIIGNRLSINERFPWNKSRKNQNNAKGNTKIVEEENLKDNQ